MTFKELYKICKNKAKEENWHFNSFDDGFEIMDVNIFESGEVALDDGVESYLVAKKAPVEQQFEFIKARLGLYGYKIKWGLNK